jgi:hypothetical protein
MKSSAFIPNLDKKPLIRAAFLCALPVDLRLSHVRRRIGDVASFWDQPIFIRAKRPTRDVRNQMLRSRGKSAGVAVSAQIHRFALLGQGNQPIQAIHIGLPNRDPCALRRLKRRRGMSSIRQTIDTHMPTQHKESNSKPSDGPQGAGDFEGGFAKCGRRRADKLLSSTIKLKAGNCSYPPPYANEKRACETVELWRKLSLSDRGGSGWSRKASQFHRNCEAADLLKVIDSIWP